MKILMIFSSMMFLLSAKAQPLSSLDRELLELIKTHKLEPLEKTQTDNIERIRLGAMLFRETKLSGPENISCNVCHHPRFGTSDGIPFSIGQGGQGIGTFRVQNQAGITKRHSPHLINLGYDDIPNMFWDGRVERDLVTGAFRTPELGLNGVSPKYPEIVKELKSALSAQVIFPMVSALEMMGENNEIADAGSNIKAWEAIVDRLLTGQDSKRYLEQFKKAFGPAKYNIGHVGEALGTFLAYNFSIVDTPYDRYLKGDLNAMTVSEKKGTKLFLGRANCISCHNGRHLSDFKFKTVAVPQFNSDTIKPPYDQGRFEVTGEKSDLFKFRTPGLRNLSLTAPYMHTGGMASIEEVVDHYDNVKKSLESFDLAKVDLSMYTDNFVVDKDPLRNKLRVNLISIGELRRGLNFTPEEREDLIDFLKTGLLDVRFQQGRQ